MQSARMHDDTEQDAALIERQRLECGAAVAIRSAAKYDRQSIYLTRGGLIAERKPNPATIAGNMLSNLPVPCTIAVNAATYPCGEPTATINFPFPGDYTVKVSAVPYLDAVFKVTQP